MKVLRAVAFAACLALVLPSPAADAQILPSEPIAFGGGRVTIGGDVSGTFGSLDPGWFDYTDYEHSALRMLRIDVSAAVNAGAHVTLLAQVRTENLGAVRPYGLYARLRPWAKRSIDVNIGRVPPTFGAFARRTYANDNPLIGYPLAYQYLTSLRPDAVPASAAELLDRRSSGWRVRYTLGNPTPDRGVPLVSAFRFDTGIQVHAGSERLRATAAVTTGTVANPLFHDDNSGRQIAARVEARPVAGLILGGSGARGPFVGATAARGAVGDGHDREFTQSAWGGDVEYSRGHYLLRYETIISDWRLPIVRPPVLDLPLRAVSTSVEGRYKIVPGVYAAARVDHLGFSKITGTTAQGTLPWDAPVTRVEICGGFSIQHNLLLKLSVQRNTRDGGRARPRGTLAAGQLAFWF
jgi:hypothetical protein